MLNVGPFELVVCFVVALVVLGPRRLPEVARWAGRVMAQVRRTTNELRHALDEEILAEERAQRRTEAERRRQERLAAAVPGPVKAKEEPRVEPGPALATATATATEPPRGEAAAPEAGGSEAQ